MYFVIALILFFLTVIESVIRKDVFLRRVLTFLAGICFFSLIGFNTWSPDLDNYRVHYANYDEEFIKLTIEPVFIFLMKMSNEYGLVFSQYIMLLGMIITFLLTYAIYKLSPLPVFVLTNFYIIPFYPDIVQLRFFFGFLLFVVGLLYFKKNKLIFLSFFTVACLSHYSILVFVLFFIIRKFSFFKSISKNNIIILTFVLILILIPKSITNPMIIYFNPKYEIYTDTENSYLGTVILFIPIYLLNLFILTHHKMKYVSVESRISKNYKVHIPILIQLIQFSNYIIIFQWFIRDFSRISMNINLFAIIYISIILVYGVGLVYSKHKALLYKTVIFLFSIVLYYVSFLMINLGEYFQIIEKTMNSNSLFTNY